MEGLKMGYTIYFWYLYGEMRRMHVFFLGTGFSDKAICSGFNGNFNWAVAANPLWFMIIGRYYDTIQSIQSIGNGHHPVRVASVLNQGGHNSPPPVPWMPLDALGGTNWLVAALEPRCLAWHRESMNSEAADGCGSGNPCPKMGDIHWISHISNFNRGWSIMRFNRVPKSLPQSHWMFEGFWRMECRILGPFLGLSGRGATRRSAFGWHPTVFFASKVIPIIGHVRFTPFFGRFNLPFVCW